MTRQPSSTSSLSRCQPPRSFGELPDSGDGLSSSGGGWKRRQMACDKMPQRGQSRHGWHGACRHGAGRWGRPVGRLGRRHPRLMLAPLKERCRCKLRAPTGSLMPHRSQAAPIVFRRCGLRNHDSALSPISLVTQQPRSRLPSFPKPPFSAAFLLKKPSVAHPYICRISPKRAQRSSG